MQFVIVSVNLYSLISCYGASINLEQVLHKCKEEKLVTGIPCVNKSNGFNALIKKVMKV